MGAITGKVHVDAVLSNLSVMYRNDEFIAEMAIPVLPVKKDSDKYYEYAKDIFRADATLWAKSTRARQVNWSVSENAYAVERHALVGLVDDDDVDNADAPIDPARDTVELLTEKLKLRKELRACEMIQTEANNGTHVDLAGTDQWNDYSNSDPLGDISTAIGYVHGVSGKRPNTMVIPWAVFQMLKDHPDITDRVKYSALGVVTKDLLGQITEIPRIVIAGAMQDTAKEGQTVTLSEIWGKHVWIGYQETRPGIKRLTHSYFFQSRKLTVEKWRDDELGGDQHRVSYKDVPKLVSKYCGYLIKTAIA